VATPDPDAMWKPGYHGEIIYPVAGVTPPRRRRSTAVGVGVVAAVAVAVTAVAFSLVRDRDSGDSSALDRIPTQIRERWTVTLDQPVGVVTGTDRVIVAHAGAELVTLDAASGTERWRVPAPSDVGAVQMIDGVVVFQDLSRGDESLTAFDVDDGDRLWSRALRRAPAVTLTGDSVVIPGFSAGGMVSSVELVDPRTGRRLAAFEGEEITMSSTAIRRRVDDVVEWYDRDTFDLRDRVDLASLGLGHLRTAGAPTDAGLVVATFDRAWLLDRDGTVVSSLSLSNKLTAPWSVDELDGSGSMWSCRASTRPRCSPSATAGSRSCGPGRSRPSTG
jgi:hypothetical protein